MEFLKKYKIILIVVVVLLVLGLGGFFLLKDGSSDEAADGSSDEAQNIKQIKAEDIGLVLTPQKNGEQVNMQITKLGGISSIEYEVSYDAEVEDEGDTVIVPRGVAGAPLDTVGKSEIDQDIDLGTCSRNVCKYDKVVSDVKFVIRVNYTNGEIGGLEATVKLDQ